MKTHILFLILFFFLYLPLNLSAQDTAAPTTHLFYGGSGNFVPAGSGNTFVGLSYRGGNKMTE